MEKGTYGFAGILLANYGMLWNDEFVFVEYRSLQG